MNFSCQIKGSLFSLSPCCCYHSCQETKGEELFFSSPSFFPERGNGEGRERQKKTLKIVRRPSFSSSSAAASLPSSLFFFFAGRELAFSTLSARRKRKQGGILSTPLEAGVVLPRGSARSLTPARRRRLSHHHFSCHLHTERFN